MLPPFTLSGKVKGSCTLSQLQVLQQYTTKRFYFKILVRTNSMNSGNK